jgi:hypothetical protein
VIDYDKPDDDPIVAEVRSAREEYAAKFNFNLKLIFEDLKRREEEARRAAQPVASSQPQPADPVIPVG